MRAKPTIRICAAVLLALGSSLAVRAAENETPPTVIGASTEAILKMQREGTAAGKPQPVSGDVASRAYKRYLESFSHPIPENIQAGSAQKNTTNVSR